MVTTPAQDVPSTTGRSRSALRWVVAAAIVALAVLTGVVVGRVTKAEPPAPSDLATARVDAMIRDQIAAVNSGDAARIAPFFAPNATLTDIGNTYGTTIKGGPEIARVLAADVATFGQFLREPVTVVQRETFAAYAGSWGDVSGGVVVYELAPDGRILNEWAIHPAQ